MSIQAIYDWESILPNAVKPILTEADLLAFTISDTAAFQKIRPRVEIVYRHIGEQKPRRWATLPDKTRRGCAFIGELKFYAISDADVPGKAAHSIYRATIRNFLAAGFIEDAINEIHLPFHKLQWLEPGNEETGIRTQDNYQQTTFPFQAMISIQQDAWSQLNT